MLYNNERNRAFGFQTPGIFKIPGVLLGSLVSSNLGESCKSAVPGLRAGKGVRRPQPIRLLGLWISSTGDSFHGAFGLCAVNRFSTFLLERKVAKETFLFASLVKTMAVFHKRVLASALPVRHAIRQTPVCLGPAELNPGLDPGDVCMGCESRQKGTRSEASGRQKGTSPEFSGLVLGK